jgi:hypothetical protein
VDRSKAHLAKQRRTADDDGRQMLAKRDAAATARAAAKEDAVATARAGLAAVTPEQRAAFLKELQAKK